MEENEKIEEIQEENIDEFAEVAEDDLSAVSGACGTPFFRCYYCDNVFKGNAKHFFQLSAGGGIGCNRHRTCHVCDTCYEAHKGENPRMR